MNKSDKRFIKRLDKKIDYHEKRQKSAIIWAVFVSIIGIVGTYYSINIAFPALIVMVCFMGLGHSALRIQMLKTIRGTSDNE